MCLLWVLIFMNMEWSQAASFKTHDDGAIQAQGYFKNLGDARFVYFNKSKIAP